MNHAQNRPEYSSPVSIGLKKQLARFREPSAWKSSWQLLSSLILFAGFWTLMLASLRFSYWLTLLLSIPTAGLLVRMFILQHDCGHGAFFKSKTLNDAVGFFLGVLVLTPYRSWRRMHALHHATAGDLDRRGHGDVHTLTVAEYVQLTPLKRFLYRLSRNPIVLFGLAPIIYFAIVQRFPSRLPPTWTRERVDVHLTNLAVLVGCLSIGWMVGFRQFALVHGPVVLLAATAGVWLFYVQHNYESTYWQRHNEWDFGAAGLAGSSYYELPKTLQWFTANIGFHHVHHLDSRIPNYRLQECFNHNHELQQVERLTLRQSLSCAQLKLWDEEAGRMIGFRDLVQTPELARYRKEPAAEDSEIKVCNQTTPRM